MNHPQRLRIIFIWICFIITGCSNNEQANETTAQQSEALLHFEKVKTAKEPREILSHLDNALAAVKNDRDTLIPLFLDYKIYYHSSLKEQDSAFYFSDSLINWAKRTQDTTDLALGYYRRSRVHFQLKDHEQVFRDAFEARRLSLLIGDSTSAGQRSLEMSLAQGRLGDQRGGQESATEALRYLDPHKDSLYISSAYNNIAISYRLQDFYDDAEKEYRNALSFATSKADSLKFMNNLAIVLQEKGEYPAAIKVFEEILSHGGHSAVSLARYRDNLAYTKWLQNPATNVEGELLETMEMRKELNDREGLLASYSHLADYYGDKNPGEVEKYAKLLLETSRNSGNSWSELLALKLLVNISPLEQDWANEYIILNDSLNSAQLSAQNTFAKIRFDEERKQQEIEILETQRANQVLEARKLRSQNLIMFLAGLLVILLLFFLIYYFRQRHKKEKIMEVHRTENRISKVIHDELANDIFNVMSSLEPVAPVPIIDKLEKIYMRTRDISRENSELDTGENYIKNLISTLSNNLPENSRMIIKGENTVLWDKIAAEKKIVIYRVLQELMVNMKKHSDAKLVAISFSREGKFLEISYSDNGVGIPDGQIKKGGGLRNVETRIFSVNGSINFESEAGKGFKVFLRIPV